MKEDILAEINQMQGSSVLTIVPNCASAVPHDVVPSLKNSIVNTGSTETCIDNCFCSARVKTFKSHFFKQKIEG